MRQNQTIENTAEIIDSRDVMARIVTLQATREDVGEACWAAQDRVNEQPDDPASHEALDAAKLALQEWEDGDEAEELRALLALQDEAEGYAPDWNHGATLIHDRYFETHARELAEDMHGSALREASWPFDHIDWEAAADALKVDYTAVDFDGQTYWVR